MCVCMYACVYVDVQVFEKTKTDNPEKMFAILGMLYMWFTAADCYRSLCYFKLNGTKLSLVSSGLYLFHTPLSTLADQIEYKRKTQELLLPEKEKQQK